MPAWQSSSLAASDVSDHNDMRHKSGLMKNTPTRISKRDIVEHKMFGSKRKNIQIGKKFRSKGKGVGNKTAISAKMPKTYGISPSIESFDKMMKSVVGRGSGTKSKGFSRKFFG